MGDDRTFVERQTEVRRVVDSIRADPMFDPSLVRRSVGSRVGDELWTKLRTRPDTWFKMARPSESDLNVIKRNLGKQLRESDLKKRLSIVVPRDEPNAEHVWIGLVDKDNAS